MHRKLLLLSAVVFALVNCGVGTRCFAEAADVSAQFEQADEYGDKGNYEQAEAIYKDVAEEYVGTESGLRAQRKLVCLYIKRGRTAEAEAAYQELLTEYADHDDIAEAVDDAADAYRDVKKYDKALEIHSYVADTWGDSAKAIDAQAGIARVNIALGREEAAEAAIEKLVADFSENEDIADTVDEVADEWRDAKKYDKALELYKYVVNTWPESEQAMGSQAEVAKLYIELGDDPNAKAAVDKLMADSSDNNDIADALDEVADEWRDAKKYDKALELYKYVVNTWPESEQAMGSQAEVAKLYIELGDDPNAKAAVDKLMADFAGRDEIADVVDYVADEYRDVKKYEKALELYKYVVNTWPESEQAIGSQGCVVRIYIERGDDPNAEAAVDKLIADFSANPDYPTALYEVVERYEKAGKYEEAKRVSEQIRSQDAKSSEGGPAQLDVGKADILALITLGDDPNAKAAVDKLIADFSANSDLAVALYEIAAKYETAAEYEEAKSLYQRVIQQDANSTQAQRAELDIRKVEVLSLMRSGDDANSMKATNKLIADFNEHPYLPEAVFLTAEQLFYARKYRPAIDLWGLIFEEYPESRLRSKIPFLLATCHERLGDKHRATEYYKQVVEEYPDSKYAYRACNRLGILFKKLQDYRSSVYWFEQQRKRYSDEVLTERALFFEGMTYLYNLKEYEKAVERCQAHVERYPENIMAAWVRYNLALATEKTAGKAEAIVILEEALRLYPNTSFTKDIRDKLAEFREGVEQ